MAVPKGRVILTCISGKKHPGLSKAFSELCDDKTSPQVLCSVSDGHGPCLDSRVKDVDMLRVGKEQERAEVRDRNTAKLRVHTESDFLKMFLLEI